jgi:integrase
LVCALRLLALTFVRPGTVAAARWAHIDLKAAMWVVPFEHLKMATEREDAGKSQDDYIIPLSRQAVALLRDLHAISGESEYLFPGYGGGPTISENTINFALHGLGFKACIAPTAFAPAPRRCSTASASTADAGSSAT